LFAWAALKDWPASSHGIRPLRFRRRLDGEQRGLPFSALTSPDLLIESEDMLEISEEDLAAFNRLVQDGLIEVVRIEDGMQYYRIASEFAGALETTDPGR
jgi:hypothetical protein